MGVIKNHMEVRSVVTVEPVEWVAVILFTCVYICGCLVVDSIAEAIWF